MRGEARHQRVARVRDAEDRAVGVVVLDNGEIGHRVAERAADDVRVRVDEPGQQRRVAEVDARARRLEWSRLMRRSGGDDAIAGHDDNAVLDGAAPVPSMIRAARSTVVFWGKERMSNRCRESNCEYEQLTLHGCP